MISMKLLKPFVFSAMTASIAWFAAGAFAQETPDVPTGTTEPAAAPISLWDLFMQSFDAFTILLLICSVVAWTVILKSFFEIRESRLLAKASERSLREWAGAGQWQSARNFVASDDTFVSNVMKSALSRASADKDAILDAGEMAASEECARWFRKIEPLNIVGNLGPLLGLSGTVYGMVIAFAALGQSGGQASPATLSLGISKALFHTLLGLLVAVPSLAAFGYFRSKIDRLCNRAMAVSSDLVQMIPAKGAGAGHSSKSTVSS